jgi:ClpP class serine protease
VLILSVPLGFGFSQMVEEHRVIKQLDGWDTSVAKVKNVHVQRFKPLTISVMLISSKPLTEEEIENVKKEIEEKLDKPILLEVSTALKK